MPVGFDEERSGIGVVTSGLVDATATHGTDSRDFRGISFRENPFPDRVVAHRRRHCQKWFRIR